MPEYDAFGNPITDAAPASAPAAATAMPAAPATSSPAPAVSPLAAPIPTIPTYGPSKTTWGERVVGLLIFLIFAAPLAIGGYVAYTSLHTAKNAVEVPAILSHTATPSPSAPAAAQPAKPTPSSVNASLLHPTALAKALRAARRDPGGHLTLLRLAPDRADLQLARRGGGLDLLQLRADGSRTLVRSPGTPGKTIAFSQVDVHAPHRLVQAAAHRLGRSAKSIDYLVLINVLGGPRWSAYFQGGAAFQGDARGHIVSRIQ